MSFVSYAQNYEDVTLFRALGDIARGAYIDVGAGDPVADSVTRAFYERGWRGVNIEPIASVHARLVEDRPEDVNLNVAVANVAGELTLHEVVGTGMSTLVAEIAESHRAGGHQVRDVRVPVTTLDTVWEEQGLDVVHFLKIDVEGAEREVLAGIDLKKHRPWVIVVESTLPNSMEPAHGAWDSLLVDSGYVFIYFDGLNRFYVASEKDAELREPLSLPPNHFDQLVRYADLIVHQRAHALASEVEALRVELRRIATSLAARAGSSDPLPAGELSPIMQWLTNQLDQRDAIRAAERAQAAHDLHVREVAHADRVGELSRMIEGLSAQSTGLQKEIVGLRYQRETEATAAEAQRAVVEQLHAEVARGTEALSRNLAAYEAERSRASEAHDAAVSQLRIELESERTRAMGTEATLAALRADHAQALARGQSLDDQLEAAASEAILTRDAIAAAQSELDAARIAARIANERHRVELEQLAADLHAARAAIDSERSETLRQREQAVLAAREMQAMRDSLSFRITAPLRSVRAAARRGVDRVLGLALETVRAVPGGVRLAATTMAYVPSVHRRLRRFADTHPRVVRLPSRADMVVLPKPAAADREPAPLGAALPARLSSRVLPRGERIVYVYVDHTVQCPVNTGMQRVARGLGRAMLEIGEILRFVKWDPMGRQLVYIDQAELRHLAQWGGPAVNAIELAHYPSPGKAGEPVPVHRLSEGHWLVVPEVTHINYHGVPITLDVVMSAKRCNLRSAVVYYDTIPLRRAEMANVSPLHETYMQQLLLADLIVPISQWSGSDIASFLVHHEHANLTPTPRIVPLLLPGESHFSPRATQPVPPRRKLILAVGTVEHRKNQHVLLVAYETFVRRHPRDGWELMLVGNVHPAIAGEVEQSQRRTPSIHVTSNLPDDELGKLYAECAFSVFPSVEEGFGLPILESLWHGTPCICADFGAMGEVAEGGGCLVVDTRSVDVLAAAIERLATNGAERARLAREACDRKLASWADYGRAFAKLMDEESDPLRNLGTIYYCLEHTVSFTHNTGIQRVVRGLARSLLELGLRVVPCKWNNATGALDAPSEGELSHFAQWNGPAVSAWTREGMPHAYQAADWLLVPELTVYPGGPDLAAIKAFSIRHALRVATVFYDAVPWKMSALYGAHWGEQHARYMEAIGKFDRVLAISEHSREDLLDFSRALKSRTPDLERRIAACTLPGEFIEAKRSRAIRRYEGGPVKILSVGSIEPRKNHLRLLRAFRDAQDRCNPSLELKLAGGFHMPEPDGAEFKRLVAEIPGVTWEQDADDARLRVLYAQADFTVYPSLEEGFGLPILESLWNARPCICRDRSAMAEVAQGGGCVMVDTADEQALAAKIYVVASDHAFRLSLAEEAIARPFRTWNDYGRDFAANLADERYVERQQPLAVQHPDAFYRAMVNLSRRPRLSICITTYNRGSWLAVSLQNLARLWPEAHPEVEIVVCDNASTDDTHEVVQPYLARADFRYYRNPINVGMLGNLQVTAHHARGRHVWIIGDDDLLKPGAVERVLAIVTEKPDLALIYLNYAYTREEDARKITDLDGFLADSVPLAEPGPDEYGPIRHLATKSENFFTAIYCLVFRRDHALRAYSQITDGRPFSTMLTCIPTSYHVMQQMMDEPGCWVGEPQLVVNMNVSWIKYAPLWILERLPELFDTAEVLGADAAEIDRWRAHNVPGVVHFFREIFENDAAGNAQYFSPARLVARFKHVDAFAREVPRLKAIYEAARARGATGTKLATDDAFPAFRNA